MIDEEFSFKQWMANNWMHLQGYAPNEIAQLGLACGFTMKEIAGDVCDWLSKSQRLLRLLEDKVMYQKWNRAMLTQLGHDTDETPEDLELHKRTSKAWQKSAFIDPKRRK